MNEQTIDFRRKDNGFIKAPAYPFTARDLFGDLRRRLSREHRFKITLDRLGQIMGQSISTTHHWFEVYPHPHVLGFMSLLERLSPSQRHAFIEGHCRVFPSLTQPRLAHSPARSAKLFALLTKKAGLSIVTGGTEAGRIFLVTAFANTFTDVDEKHRSAGGIDLHFPSDVVPIGSIFYIDSARGLDHIRQVTRKIWPRLLTSRAPLLLFNRVWSSVPEVRNDVLRLSQYKHIILADEEMPSAADLKKTRESVHLLTVSGSQHVSDGIRVNCRCKRR